MAKMTPGKKDLDSYAIKGRNKIMDSGDYVLARPSDSDKPPYVAREEKTEADRRNNVMVKVGWYYRPEESIGDERPFHRAKELFLSDHYDGQSAHTIEGECVVHSFKNCTKLENVGTEDYFCRLRIQGLHWYYKCKLPCSPDDLMAQCKACKDWSSIGQSVSLVFLNCFNNPSGSI